MPAWTSGTFSTRPLTFIRALPLPSVRSKRDERYALVRAPAASVAPLSRVRPPAAFRHTYTGPVPMICRRAKRGGARAAPLLFFFLFVEGAAFLVAGTLDFVVPSFSESLPSR